MIADWLARRGLLRHQVYYYPGFPGAAGHAACLRCGQPFTVLGIPLDDQPCRGRYYRWQMERASSRKLQELFWDQTRPLKIVMNPGEGE